MNPEMKRLFDKITRLAKIAARKANEENRKLGINEAANPDKAACNKCKIKAGANKKQNDVAPIMEERKK